MHNFITAYVKGCATCQMNKVNIHPTKPPLFLITLTSDLPFQTIVVNFITKLLPSQGYDTILTVTDHNVSKTSIFILCQESIDSEGVAKLYASQVFPHYGIPLKIISNHNTQFDSAFTKELCQLLGIKQNISSAYHPRTDGQSKYTNQSLEQYLQLYCDTQQNKWTEFLPLSQYVQNSWKHSTTKQTPYDTLIGYTPLTPAHTYSHGSQYHRPLITHNRGLDCHPRGITKSTGPINPWNNTL